MNLSAHPAPTVHRVVNATSCQWANRPGAYRQAFCSQASPPLSFQDTLQNEPYACAPIVTADHAV